MQLWSYNHTTASSQRTPAGFANNFNLRLEPTQQQDFQSLLQDLQQIQLWSCNHTTASSQRTPAGFTTTWYINQINQTLTNPH